MAMAMFDSVTVSMGLETMGVFSAILGFRDKGLAIVTITWGLGGNLSLQF